MPFCHVDGRQYRLYLISLLLLPLWMGLWPLSAVALQSPLQLLEPVTLQLKWKHAFQFAGYYAALAKGYYREVGLEVTIQEHDGLHAPIDVLLDGQAQYAVTGVDVMVQRAQGKPLVALAAIFQHSPYALLVKADSGIQGVEDLAGRRVMLGTGLQDAELRAMLLRGGLKEGQYETVPSSFKVESLLKGEVDAFNAYVTDQGFTLEEAGVPARFLMPKQYGVDFYGDILTTTEQEVREHPDRVFNFRQASLKGWQYALSHPEEIVQLILQRYNTQQMSPAHLRYEASATRELIQPLLVEIGYMNMERWRHIEEIFAQVGAMRANNGVEKLVYRPPGSVPAWMVWLRNNWYLPLLLLFSLLAALLLLFLVQMRRLVERRSHELARSVESLEHLAHHDPLTNLPNRILFSDRLELAINKAHRNSSLLAVLFVDLDRFKEINDSLGHQVGDQVLQLATRRFQHCVREGDTLARLGGDEFTLIIEALPRPQAAVVLAQKLITSLQAPFEVDAHQFYLSASIGISLYPQDGQTVETLLRNADTAMYRAKEEGRNTFQFYTEDMTEQAFERMLLESNLRRALHSDQLDVYYQSQVDAATGEILAVEALMRWHHPEMGLISPAKFIPLAEETGLIQPMGLRIMEIAFRQMVAWEREGIRPARLAVNLSRKQLEGEELGANLQWLMAQTQCRPEWLEMEVTEGFLMRNPERAIHVLREVRELGIELAIDDFGTGYSSLAYLKRFPINRLKIDQSFVRDLPDDQEDVAIARAIIALARNLSLEVIAEGVESTEQRNFLLSEGCAEQQGFLFSKPLPVAEVTALLLQWKRDSHKGRGEPAA